MRESFIFYRSFHEALKALNSETRLAIYDAICEFALNGNELELEGVSNAVFTLIKPQILANNKRYENGRKGGRPRKTDNQEGTEPKPKQNQSKTKPEPNENVNENVNVNDNDNKTTFTLSTIIKAQEPELQPVLREYSQFRKKIKAPLTTRALTQAISKARSYTGGNVTEMVKVFEQSIDNGWKGVYPIGNRKQGLSPNKKAYLELEAENERFGFN